MSLNQDLPAAFDIEGAGTRKTLERVPGDKSGWKPHSRSWTLGELANNLAMLPE